MEFAMYQVIVNSLSTHIAVLDEYGNIIETNHAWQEFARNNGMPEPFDCVGMNYLSVCDSDSQDSEKSSIVGAAIRKVISGEIQEFNVQYPCHSPVEKRWYNLRVVAYQDKTVKRAIVTHENITPIMIVQEKLRNKEHELKVNADKLEETNVALKVLLEHRQKDIEEMGSKIVTNIRQLALPYLEKLKAASSLNERELAMVDIAINNLQDILAPFLTRLSSVHIVLTPQEIEVASLVRQGKSSQEIADLLSLSVATVSFHRKKIRKKLGLGEHGGNLRAHLLGLQ